MSILKRIHNMLNGDAGAAQVEKGGEALAAAVLMVEVAAGDGQISRPERERILSLLQHRLGLSAEDALELFVEAIATHDEANQMLHFTRKIKDHFDEAGREKILELLWEVVFADGAEDAYESNLLRRVAGLLYVSDRRNGEIRKKVKAST
ncbi:hypothetical protein MNBD_ALPHA02-972 [hydrothermal vent metagenome]|uniref:Co-chaperone DjlA N-terminal domain-containing protein n=1 Tax=hydrothermal vent metagenome TaxID=652676 RepID=A0A3B0RGR5_9ZZZZ